MLALYKLMKFIFRYFIPPRLRYPLVRLIGRVVCRFNRARRQVIEGNLTPLVGAPRAKEMAPVLLGNFLMTAVDFFCKRPRLWQDVTQEGWERVEAVYQETRRVMLVTAHLGHWELGISCLVKKGVPVTGVYAPYTDDAIVEWIMGHRDPRVEWIPTAPGAAESCIAAVEQGRMLGMVADIPFGEKGRSITIAGHTARLPVGPWLIAVRAKATVFPAFIIRQSPGRYRMVIHEPINPSIGTLTRQIKRMQAVYQQHLEFYLQHYPEQWGVLVPFWNHS